MKNGHTYKLESIVPDVTLKHLPLISNLKILQELGAGAFGKVYKAQTADGALVAVKSLKVMEEENSIFAFKEFSRELLVMSQIEHQNLVQLYGIGRSEENKLMMVMEFCPGNNLSNVLTSNPINTQLKLKIALDIAKG